MNGQTNCGLSTKDYYMAMKSSEVLTPVSTERDFENMMLSEKSQSQKITLHDSICIKYPQ